MANIPIVTSANAKFAIKKFVTVCICLVVATIHITNELPTTAKILMVPQNNESRTIIEIGTSYNISEMNEK